MREVATAWMESVSKQHSNSGGGSASGDNEAADQLVFRLGFHSLPSMRQLHLHVISQDLSGEGMKKKAHYQRFVTPFFITLDEVQ
jgi:hypothetical protein